MTTTPSNNKHKNAKIKNNVRGHWGPGTCCNETRDPQRFTTSEVAADWRETVVPPTHYTDIHCPLYHLQGATHRHPGLPISPQPWLLTNTHV